MTTMKIEIVNEEDEKYKKNRTRTTRNGKSKVQGRKKEDRNDDKLKYCRIKN